MLLTTSLSQLLSGFVIKLVTTSLPLTIKSKND